MSASSRERETVFPSKSKDLIEISIFVIYKVGRTKEPILEQLQSFARRKSLGESDATFVCFERPLESGSL